MIFIYERVMFSIKIRERKTLFSSITVICERRLLKTNQNQRTFTNLQDNFTHSWIHSRRNVIYMGKQVLDDNLTERFRCSLRKQALDK